MKMKCATEKVEGEQYQWRLFNSRLVEYQYTTGQICHATDNQRTLSTLVTNGAEHIEKEEVSKIQIL